MSILQRACPCGPCVGKAAVQSVTHVATVRWPQAPGSATTRVRMPSPCAAKVHGSFHVPEPEQEVAQGDAPPGAHQLPVIPCRQRVTAAVGPQQVAVPFPARAGGLGAATALLCPCMQGIPERPCHCANLLM